MTFGVYRLVNYKTIQIDELPIGMWTEDYKEFLETLLFDAKPLNLKRVRVLVRVLRVKENPMRDHQIKGYLRMIENHSTESPISFRLNFFRVC